MAGTGVHPTRRGAAAGARPLKEEVRSQGLWATHLGPELGGQGYGQLKLALLNEVLGRDLLASRAVVPHIGAAFPFDDVVAALEHVAEGRAIGKVVVEMAGS